jgi:RHS repeat-associated protein
LERYVYDAVGNFVEMEHRGSDPLHPGWTRHYTCNEVSLLENGQGETLVKMSNRLTSTKVGGGGAETHGYDAHGNMLGMSQLQVMDWDYRDQLQVTQRQKVNDEEVEGIERHGERTWYVYDAAGQRVRKVTERANNGGLKEERIYLGGVEIHRRHAGANAGLVRETLHLMDDKQRIALVETRNTIDDGSPPQLIRYQFGNHLGSACLELDHEAHIITYEEYSPYGSTVYQAVRRHTETAKRYRYTGKERDEESGLYYHGARYYAPWLGRWVSCDPAGIAAGLNLYCYVNNDPIHYRDPNGKWPKLVDNFLHDPVGTSKQAAQTYGKVFASYTEARIKSLSEQADLLNPAVGTVKIAGGAIQKGMQEAAEIKKEYELGGGGGKGAARATARALAGPLAAHATQAMIRASQHGASAQGVADAGLSKVADETNESNPLYHLGVATVGAPVAAFQALERDDPSAAGKHMSQGQDSAQEVAKAVMPVAASGAIAKGVARFRSRTPLTSWKTVRFGSAGSPHTAAVKEYWKAFRRTGSFQRAGEAFHKRIGPPDPNVKLHKELGAPGHGPDQLLHSNGPGGAVLKEHKTTVLGPSQELAQEASQQSMGYSADYQRKTGLVPIRIVELHDMVKKVIHRGH